MHKIYKSLHQSSFPGTDSVRVRPDIFTGDEEVNQCSALWNDGTTQCKCSLTIHVHISIDVRVIDM